MCPKLDVIDINEPTKKPDPRVLNASKHLMTGNHVVLQSPAEQADYCNFHELVEKGLQPATEYEKILVRKIANDEWRLNRGFCIESNILANDVGKIAHISDHPEIDHTLANTKVWCLQAKHINLLSQYERRIQRNRDDNLEILRQMQAERRAAFERAAEEAAILAEYARRHGQNFNIEKDFPPAAIPSQFDFSLVEISARATYKMRLAAALKEVKPAIPPRRKAA
jgi:hypothetical protein